MFVQHKYGGIAINSAEVARIRLLGVVHQDRETAPTFRWKKTRAACLHWFRLTPGTMGDFVLARRARKAKYRLERRT